METLNQDKSKTSELEKLKLYFEHTDDSRIVVNQRTGQIVKRPRRHIASVR